MGEPLSPSDSVKRRWNWPFDKAKHGHLLHRSKDRMDIQEYELGRTCRSSDSNKSSTSLTSKFVSFLPRGFVNRIDRRVKQERSQQREWAVGVLISAYSASAVLFLNIVLTIIAVSMSYPKYNSTVFSALGTREYGVLLASANFDFNNPPNHGPNAGCFEQNISMNMSTFYSEVPKFERLDTQKCIDTYAADYIADRGTLILVTNNVTADNGSLRWVSMGNSPQQYSSYSFLWMCQSEPNYPQFIHDDIPGERNCEKFPCQKECKRGDCETVCLGDWSVSSMPWSDPLLSSNMSYSTNSSLAKEIQNTGATCALDSVRADSLPALSVDYCLSQKVEEECQLLFSLPICIIVILCNIVKIVCMFMTAHDPRKEIFLTVGDAISSFLNRPDMTTEGNCLLSKNLVSMGRSSWERSSKPAKLQPRKKRWRDAVGGPFFAVTIVFCLLLLLMSSVLFYLGVTTLRAKGQSIKPTELWKLGFGTITSTAIIRFCDNPSNCSGTIPIALLANIPQIIISVAYFLYNNMLTAMLLAAEYNDYAIERKPLRVSWAKGLQRSTYYLSLPYRYSIPLMICNTILHWLVSQSFFFVEVVLYDMAGKLTAERLIACGYSPIALMVAILLGFVMVCSAAISAACHPPPGDNDHALKPVMWGETSAPQVDSSSNGEIAARCVSQPDTRQYSSVNKPLHRANESQTELLGKGNGFEDDGEAITPVVSSPYTESRFSDEGSPCADQAKSHVNLLGESSGAGGRRDSEYGHCSFSSMEVSTPSTERLYL
ncbi:hypothetical protein SI65_04105 [Aspergillus cristatus]|uniref:Uncharacterized protein n=1 Tax=Aspergillus cristatus TaxID=573508 RepID=A0A1E3BJ98_ASPCR|nr:hypothetical protein SI65_04105 [Aspergillus cristatus]